MKYLATPVLVLALSFAAICVGQEKTEKATDDIADKIQAVYAKTSTAKSAKEYGEMIADCEELLVGELSDKHRNYLQSLASWAHNRRGAIRLEISQQFRKIDNIEQANTAHQLAMDDFDKAIEMDDSRWRAYLNRGVAKSDIGEYPAAIEEFTQMITLNSKDPTGWFNRAELYYETRNYKRALEDYEHVLELSPGDLQAVTGRAHSLFQLARYDEALKEYDAVLKLKPGSAWGLANRGDAHQALGNWQQAYDDYTDALEKQMIGGIYQRLAWMLATCPDQEVFAAETALVLAKKAIDMDGENAVYLDTLAAAHAANGDFEEARTWQSRAIEMAENEPAEYKERMAMFEQQKPFQQEVKR